MHTYIHTYIVVVIGRPLGRPIIPLIILSIINTIYREATLVQTFITYRCAHDATWGRSDGRSSCAADVMDIRQTDLTLLGYTSIRPA